MTTEITKRTKASLIKKELLPNNFKLTFRNQSGKVHFLILHENQGKIYEHLEINQVYSYTWKKGNKNYCFINPQSIQKEAEHSVSTNENLKQQAKPERGLFIQQLIKDCQLKDLTEKEFFDKAKQLQDKFKRISQSDNIAFTLDWVKEFMTVLLLKHDKLEKEQHVYNEQEQKEHDLLAEIGAIFLQDWIYYQNKRESKYNQVYYEKETKESLF